MTSESFILEKWLEDSGALKKGHFQLSSGLHSPAYVQCALLLEDPGRALRIGSELVTRLGNMAPQSVVSPALGGLIVGFAVAAALQSPFRFVERVDGQMALRRGFFLQREERVVIVEDVVTTGKSTREAMQVVRQHGAQVCGVVSILDRTAAGDPFDVPFVSLLDLNLPAFEEPECPLCARGLSLDKPGSRPIP